MEGRDGFGEPRPQPRQHQAQPQLSGVERPLALDLFSGTGSVKWALEKRGWTVISVDMDPKYEPDVVADIETWKFQKDFPPTKYKFDVIATSPPCTE